MADVFISYSSKNQECADNLLKYLEDNGIDCWMAPRNIPGGSYYAKEIPNAIYGAPVFLIVLSNDAQKSEYVLRELDYATSINRTILPFVIDENPLIPEFDFLLRTKQQYRFLSEEPVYENLLNRIREICEKKEIAEFKPIIVESDKVEKNRIPCPLCDSNNLWETDDWLDDIQRIFGRMIYMVRGFMIIGEIFLFGLFFVLSLDSVTDPELPDILRLIMGAIPFAILIYSPIAIIDICLWCQEQRRRIRVRKHIRVQKYICMECRHKFKVVTDLKTVK